MISIAHVAIKVDNLEAAKEFYSQVFGFKHILTHRVRDHVSCHMTDGNIDVALIKYDSGADSAEATAAGSKPAIHHIGFAVDDIEKYREEIVKRGCEIISGPGVVPVKFRAPGGTVAEIGPASEFRGARPRT